MPKKKKSIPEPPKLPIRGVDEARAMLTVQARKLYTENAKPLDLTRVLRLLSRLSGWDTLPIENEDGTPPPPEMDFRQVLKRAGMDADGAQAPANVPSASPSPRCPSSSATVPS